MKCSPLLVVALAAGGLVGCTSISKESLTMPDGKKVTAVAAERTHPFAQDALAFQLRDYRPVVRQGPDGEPVTVYEEINADERPLMGRMQSGFAPSTVNTAIAGGAQVLYGKYYGQHYGENRNPNVKIHRRDSRSVNLSNDSQAAGGSSDVSTSSQSSSENGPVEIHGGTASASSQGGNTEVDAHGGAGGQGGHADSTATADGGNAQGGNASAESGDATAHGGAGGNANADANAQQQQNQQQQQQQDQQQQQQGN